MTYPVAFSGIVTVIAVGVSTVTFVADTLALGVL